jgi:hypothetical protein
MTNIKEKHVTYREETCLIKRRNMSKYIEEKHVSYKEETCHI